MRTVSSLKFPTRAMFVSSRACPGPCDHREKLRIPTKKDTNPIYSLTSSQRCGYINWVCICQRCFHKNQGNVTRAHEEGHVKRACQLYYRITCLFLLSHAPICMSRQNIQRCCYINWVCICQRCYLKNQGNVFYQKILP